MSITKILNPCCRLNVVLLKNRHELIHYTGQLASLFSFALKRCNATGVLLLALKVVFVKLSCLVSSQCLAAAPLILNRTVFFTPGRQLTLSHLLLLWRFRSNFSLCWLLFLSRKTALVIPCAI